MESFLILLLQTEELLQKVNELEWLHSIDLGNGVVTPGKWGAPSELVLKAFDTIDFSGKKVLDVGTCNGLWAFEAEKRGAKEVHAIDFLELIDYAYQPAFSLAHQALNSQVHYHPDTAVYDVERLGISDFDIVLFLGVYYHIKNPLLALAKLRRVTRSGGRILISGDVIHNEDDAFARFYYRTYHVHESNWWVPSIACLREWAECSFFDIRDEFNSARSIRRGTVHQLKTKLRGLMGKQAEDISRHVLVAEAVTRKETFKPVPQDSDLAEFQIR